MTSKSRNHLGGATKGLVQQLRKRVAELEKEVDEQSNWADEYHDQVCRLLQVSEEAQSSLNEILARQRGPSWLKAQALLAPDLLIIIKDLENECPSE